MSKHRRIDIQFPLAGLNRKSAYRQQPPFSSPDLLNVRPVGTIEGRERGGSRPGLTQSHVDDLGSNVRLLSPMTIAFGDSFTVWSDTFSGSSMAEAWSIPSWATSMPLVLPSALASVDTSLAEGEAVLDVLPIDTTEAYTVEVYLVPWAGEWHGDYRLYLRLDDTTPDIATDGVVIELVQTGTTGAYTASMKSYLATVETETDTATGTIAAKPGWLSATVVGNVVTVYWNGVSIMSGTVGAQTGTRVGFGLECTVSGGLCLANVFRVQYYSTGTVPEIRSLLVASAGGSLYRETTCGRMSAVTSDLSLADLQLTATQSGQDLYIADYGSAKAHGTDGTVSGSTIDAASYADWTTLGISAYDDVCVISNVGGATVAGTYKIQSIAAGAVTLASAPGDGTCAYRIERAPKIYHPLTNTIEIMYASAGQVPSGCPLICRAFDRVFLAGAEIAPHVWYCSRKSAPLDFDYAATDDLRAVAGLASAAGVPGNPLKAMIPFCDDYVIFACRESLWRLCGDPVYGGALNSLSQTIGVIGQDAWCVGPSGEIVFLSLDGLYVLPPGGNTYPISLSRELLPREFMNLDPNSVTANLEYDVQGRGIHIFLSPDSSNARMHWWFDWDGKRFWPVSLAADHEPMASCTYQGTAIEESGVILGCRDGILRRFSDLADNDCGIAFTSYAMLGPIALAADSMVGNILSIDAVIADGSGSVTWSLQPALTFEGTVTATATDTGTWSEGLNATVHPACRGQAFVMKITGTGTRWAVESITAVVKDAGRRRLA